MANYNTLSSNPCGSNNSFLENFVDETKNLMPESHAASNNSDQDDNSK